MSKKIRTTSPNWKQGNAQRALITRRDMPCSRRSHLDKKAPAEGRPERLDASLPGAALPARLGGRDQRPTCIIGDPRRTATTPRRTRRTRKDTYRHYGIALRSPSKRSRPCRSQPHSQPSSEGTTANARVAGGRSLTPRRGTRCDRRRSARSVSPGGWGRPKRLGNWHLDTPDDATDAG
jgi:hypothetical protein